MKDRTIVAISLLVFVLITVQTILVWRDCKRQQEEQMKLNVKAMHNFYYNETLKVKSEVGR